MTSPIEPVTPSVLAAQMARSHAQERVDGRAYPLAPVSRDPEALGVELAATQALLRAGSSAEVAAIVATLIRDLGGALIPARYADPATVVPLDVSLGLSEPLMPFADPVSVARMRLETVLPAFSEAARLVLERLQGDVRPDQGAALAHLTGAMTRAAWMRRLSEAVPGDSICLIHLDNLNGVNDDGGRAARDSLLLAIEAMMRHTFRQDDACARYDGDDLVCLSPGLPGQSLVASCERLRRVWEQERPVNASLVGLSMGVVEIGEAGARAALELADTAMRRAKTEGGNRTVLVSAQDGDRGLGSE